MSLMARYVRAWGWVGWWEGGRRAVVVTTVVLARCFYLWC